MLGHSLPSSSHKHLVARTSGRLLVRRASKQQASPPSLAPPVQQYTAPQPVLHNSQQDKAPSCKLDRNSGALERDEYGKFVQFFRQASPYIEGHRSRTFVIVLPGVLQQAYMLIKLNHGISITSLKCVHCSNNQWSCVAATGLRQLYPMASTVRTPESALLTAAQTTHRGSTSSCLAFCLQERSCRKRKSWLPSWLTLASCMAWASGSWLCWGHTRRSMQHWKSWAAPASSSVATGSRVLWHWRQQLRQQAAAGQQWSDTSAEAPVCRFSGATARARARCTLGQRSMWCLATMWRQSGVGFWMALTLASLERWAAAAYALTRAGACTPLHGLQQRRALTPAGAHAPLRPLQPCVYSTATVNKPQ